MKRVVLLLLMAIGFHVSYAQTRAITGKVSSAEDGPIPGVSIIVKGSTLGTVTDLEGTFKLIVPANSKALVFTYVGMKTKEVILGKSNEYSVKLEPAAFNVDEVVVTALGISREKKALGYAVQDVKGDDLSKVRGNNVVTSLSGRVSGVQITTASGQMGGGAKINVRGNTSLTKNNQPLFVVDGIPLDNSDYSYGDTGRGGYDYGNLAADLNPDDIESISVLKGASASALYGSRAANGVIMVTTKKAKLQEKKTIGVSVNSSLTWEKASIVPEYQKQYGGGYIVSNSDGGVDGFEIATINGKDYKVPQYSTDEGWGPKYDPNQKVLYWNAFDSWDKANYLVEKPWTYPTHDYKYFFKTGVSKQNNVALTGGDQNNSFRLSYTNLDYDGIYQNSYMKRNTVSFSGTSKLTNAVDAWFNVNYVSNVANGRPETGYGDRNPVQKMWQWIHPSLDYKELEAYMNPDGTQRSWNRNAWNDAAPAYTDNPYWSIYKNYENDRRDRVYGNTGFNIKLLPWLKFTGRTGIDYYTFRMEERMAVGSQAQSDYLLDVRSLSEMNAEMFFTIDKRFADDKYGVSAIIGANRMDRKSWRNGGETTGGLVVPDLYNLNNSLVKASSYDTKTWKRVNSMYANATIDYNHFAYLELTARNDWSSTLPVNNRSYFYPSANLSLVLTELDAFKDLDYLSFAKIRGGYAQVGNDTSPYDYLDYYTQNATFMDSSLDQNPRMSLSSTKANDNLKPEKTSSWEIGTELKFFKNRLGIDLSYYKKVTTNQIVPVRVSGATGYGFMNINAGKMTNKGIEVSLTGTPIKQINGLQWDVTLNFATLNNTVNEIAPGLDYLSLGSAPFKAQSGAFKGMGYPVIYGTDFVYDDKGNKVVDADGMWLTSGVKPLANVTPKYTAGLTNSFSYKGFDLSILLDMQRGGHTYYTSYMWGMYSGLLAESAAINANGKNIREDIANGGGVLNNAVYGTIDANTGKVVYTDASGNVSAKPVKNTTYVDAQTWAEYHYDGPDAQNIFNTNFVKLREIRFGYTVPARYTGPVKGLRISAFGRDLATWGRASKHFDPEYLQMAGSNAQGIEGGYIPSTKTYGIGLNFNF